MQRTHNSVLRLLLLGRQPWASASGCAAGSGRCLGTVGGMDAIPTPKPADQQQAKIPTTTKLGFVGSTATVPSYQTINQRGEEVEGCDLPHPLSEELALKIYTTMAKLQTMDTLFYDAQRQGRLSFYLTSQGEEATVVGSAAGLEPQDVVFAQYREQGVLMWRGFTLQQFANQVMGNAHEPGKGRQMPVHYGSRELNFHTISSPLTTQLPHAVGAAYALKLSRQPAVSVAYFGDGAASEGDFHAALNFAATLEAPTLFICRNNGYAISTPTHEQYRGDGVVARGPALGIQSIRVDGGDARAMYNAVREARAMALAGPRPVLLEAMSYRQGHHSTSDDSSRYRTAEEMRAWRARDPVSRFRQWLAGKGWWDEGREQELRKVARQQVMEALEAAGKVPKAPLDTLVTDVYADVPWHLKEQLELARATIKRHPEVLPPDVPLA